jgi:hypothetical protein
MPKLKLSDDLKKLLDELIDETEKSRVHTNAKNRANTAVRNFFKERVQTKEWGLETKIVHRGLSVEYSAADRTEIDPSDFYAMFKEGEITEEQFLKCISVRKSDVKTHVGSDVLITLEKPVEGDNYAIRLTDMPTDEGNVSYVLVPMATAPIKRKKIVKPNAATKTSKVKTVKVSRKA